MIRVLFVSMFAALALLLFTPPDADARHRRGRLRERIAERRCHDGPRLGLFERIRGGGHSARCESGSCR